MAYNRQSTSSRTGGSTRVVAIILLAASSVFLLREAALYALSHLPRTDQEDTAVFQPPVSKLRGSASADIVLRTASATAISGDLPTCEPPCRRLRNGVEMPYLMYGTAWKEERSEKLVSLALSTGFRAIDTANQRRHYNEVGAGAAVTKAVRSGEINRSELFLQSKYTFPRGHLKGQEPYELSATPADQVMQSFESSLQHFGGTSYLDSFIIHGPFKHGPTLSETDFEVWLALEQLYKAGRVRAIGVSNFGQQQLRQLLADPRTTVAPHVAQIRTFAGTGWDDRVGGVRAVCEEAGIAFEAFSLLTANRHALSSPTVSAIAKKRGETKEQVAFRFALGEDMVVLTGTTDERHMQLDIDVVKSMRTGGGSAAGAAPSIDWRLDPMEASEIRDIGHGKRKAPSRSH